MAKAKPCQQQCKKANSSECQAIDILKKTKPLVRSTLGRNVTEKLQQKLAEKKVSVRSEKTLEAIAEIIQEQLDGVKSRIYPRIDAAIENLKQGK